MRRFLLAIAISILVTPVLWVIAVFSPAKAQLPEPITVSVIYECADRSPDPAQRMGRFIATIDPGDQFIYEWGFELLERGGFIGGNTTGAGLIFVETAALTPGNYRWLASISTGPNKGASQEGFVQVADDCADTHVLPPWVSANIVCSAPNGTSVYRLNYEGELGRVLSITDTAGNPVVRGQVVPNEPFTLLVTYQDGSNTEATFKVVAEPTSSCDAPVEVRPTPSVTYECTKFAVDPADRRGRFTATIDPGTYNLNSWSLVVNGATGSGVSLTGQADGMQTIIVEIQALPVGTYQWLANMAFTPKGTGSANGLVEVNSICAALEPEPTTTMPPASSSTTTTVVLGQPPLPTTTTTTVVITGTTHPTTTTAQAAPGDAPTISTVSPTLPATGAMATVGLSIMALGFVIGGIALVQVARRKPRTSES